MASNQGDRQASAEAITSTSLNYEGDFMALFTAAGIPDGAYNGRLLSYINQALGASYTELSGAQQAFALAKSSNGAKSWNELGSFTISVSTGSVLQTDAASHILLAGGGKLLKVN